MIEKRQIGLLVLVWMIGFHGEARSEYPDLVDAFNWIIWESRKQISENNREMNRGSGSYQRSQECQSFYDRIWSDGIAQVSVALGYMDVSTGENYVHHQKLLGKDFVLDSYARESLAIILTQDCVEGLLACGFHRESESLLVREIQRPNGQKLKVQLNLTHASESSSNDSNTKELAALQKERTIRSEANFFGSIQSGVDVAIYMGHARSGGGPDFSPPRLLRSGLPDYAFYRREKNGIRRLLKSLDNSLFPPAVVGLLACKSTQLFVSKIEKQVPNSLIVSAGDLFDYNDIVPTGFALLDSLLAEKCSSFFSESVRVRPLSADFLHFSRLP